jgi:ribonuclease HI
MGIEIFADGGAEGNPGPSAGAVVVKIGKKIVTRKSFYIGRATNNVAEYQALICGLEIASNLMKKQNFREFIIYSDSELVINQVLGKYRVKDKELRQLHKRVLTILDNLKKGACVKLICVGRGRMKDVHRLVKRAILRGKGT